jgi:hypothetical protein
MPSQAWGAACSTFNLCTDPYTLVGTSTSYPGGAGSYIIELTNGGGWQAGAAWNPDQIDLTQDFDYTFQLNFGTGAADGMTFTLQNAGPNLVGNSGGDLGIAGDPTNYGSGPHGVTLTPAVSVEFDLFQNSASNLPDNNDPGFQHMAIDENGVVDHHGCSTLCPVAALPSAANINDGLYHNVRVAWSAASHTMTVYFDGNLRITYTKDIVTNIFGGNGCVYFGFTAGTGGASTVQKVKLISCLPTPTASPTASDTPTPYPPGCGTPFFQEAHVIDVGCLGSTGSVSAAYSFSTAPNQLLVVHMSTSNKTGTPSNVQFGGVPMSTFALSTNNAGNGGNSTKIYTYYLASPPTTGPLTFNFPNAGCSWDIETELYNNVDVSNPVGTFNTVVQGTATSGSAPYTFNYNVTTFASASLISNFIVSDQIQNTGDKPLMDSGQTDMNLLTVGPDSVDGGGGEAIASNWIAETAAGTYNMQYTLNQAGRWYTAQPMEIRGNNCNTPTNTPIVSSTDTPTVTPTSTSTASPTPLAPTGTPTFTSTVTPTFTITLTPTPPNTPTPTPLPLKLTPKSPNPNPAGGLGVWWPYVLSVDANVTIHIYDVAGEEVRRFDPIRQSAGPHEQYWNLINVQSQKVSSGIYICQIKADSDRGETETVFEKCAVAR